MKKLLLTLGLSTLTLTSAIAQGTIQFANSALTRVTTCDGNGFRNATAADNLTIGVWYGFSEDSLMQAPGTSTIGSTDGVMAGAASVFALPGTVGNQTVALQIRVWNPAYGWYAATKVAQVTLGPTAGPGAVIWQTQNGTNPNRFHPMYVGPLTCIPEPSTTLLGVMSVGLMVAFRRTRR